MPILKYCVGMIAFLLVGCTQNTSDPSMVLPTPSKEPIVSKQEKSSSNKYNDYLLSMKESDRSEFLSLDSDGERDHFLRLRGWEQQKYLNEHLKLGMSPEKILEFLGRPKIQETNFFKNTYQSRWIYSFFNGYCSIRYIIFFQENKLVAWEIL